MKSTEEMKRVTGVFPGRDCPVRDLSFQVRDRVCRSCPEHEATERLERTDAVVLVVVDRRGRCARREDDEGLEDDEKPFKRNFRRVVRVFRSCSDFPELRVRVSANCTLKPLEELLV